MNSLSFGGGNLVHQLYYQCQPLKFVVLFYQLYIYIYIYIYCKNLLLSSHLKSCVSAGMLKGGTHNSQQNGLTEDTSVV